LGLLLSSNDESNIRLFAISYTKLKTYYAPDVLEKIQETKKNNLLDVRNILVQLFLDPTQDACIRINSFITCSKLVKVKGKIY